ncbi:helix-turn-helix transcriptional regulator [Actinokineospora sp. NPDC004072]
MVSLLPEWGREMGETSRVGRRRCARCSASLADDNTASMCGRCHRELSDQMSSPPANLDREFFETDEFTAAFDSRHIGRVLKAYRHHPRHLRIFGKALSQALLGRWLGGLTQAQVSRLENGEPEQNLRTLIRYARIMHLPADKLWFDLPGSRRVIRVADAIEDAVMEAANESARLLSWAESDAVGDLTIEEVSDEIRWISNNYLIAPTGPLFNRIRLLRDRLFQMIEGCRKPSRLVELYTAAGWSLSLLGWMSTDMGASQAAKSHFRTAWACAENAEADELKAWVRACQHTASFWSGDFAQAKRAAEDGLKYATTGSAKLFLSSALALDIARLGDHGSWSPALQEAKRNADALILGNDSLGGPFTCSVARATSFWSDTYLAIGDSKSALALSAEAVRLFDTAPLQLRNFGSERMARCQVVKAYLSHGELDGAQEALGPVLQTEPENRVKPLLRRVSEIADMSAALPNGNEPRALEIGEAIRSFKADSGVREIESQKTEEA